MHHRHHRLAAALALGLPLLAAAQGRAAPADPKTAAPALAHHSAFSDYQAFRDIALGDWRGLNDTVGRAALKSGTPPIESGAASAATAKTPLPQQPGHHPHHHMPGGRR